jgi:hypothetical protein
MFVSAYSTFVRTENTNNVKDRSQKSDGAQKSFELKSTKNILPKTKSVENLPLNYISNYKALCNKQKFQEQLKNDNTTKYTLIKTKKDAKTAYENSSNNFYISKKPHAIIDQGIINDTKLQETNLKQSMINVYISNDKYYQINAA